VIIDDVRDGSDDDAVMEGPDSKRFPTMKTNFHKFQWELHGWII